MDKDEYEKAWDEDDGQDGPIENAVETAAKKAKADEEDEYLTAMAELDAAEEDDDEDDDK